MATTTPSPITRATLNPIIPGFAPDPSCIRVNSTYYLVNSAFQYFPNLPIYTSPDLIHWTHVSNAIHRPSQLSLAHSFTRVNPPDQWGESMLASGGLYAPTIRYHEGVFYVVCTNVIQHLGQDGKTDRRQNFIVTTTEPERGEWSDPVFFDFDGIDVSPFWDPATGRSYIVGSAVPGPMTTIKLFEIDLHTGERLSEERLLWRGTGGVYPEGPHIYVKDGWYYLVISEGGCFEDHMITAARAKKLDGPYEAYEQNPLVTARDKPVEVVRHIGHSDLFEDLEGNWWAVCLGVRKDAQGRYLMGRETFLTPVRWSEGEWPQIAQVRMALELPDGYNHKLPSGTQPSIDAKSAAVEYIYLRNANLFAHQISASGRITLTPTGADITNGEATAKPTFIAKRMRSLVGDIASVSLHFPSLSSNDKVLNAGIILYKDEHRFARLYLSQPATSTVAGKMESGSNKKVAVKLVFEVRNAGKSISRSESRKLQLEQKGQRIDLKIVGSSEGEALEILIRIPDDPTCKDFRSFGGKIDALELTGLDFTGPVVGLFACLEGAVDERGEPHVGGGVEDVKAIFDDFVVR